MRREVAKYIKAAGWGRLVLAALALTIALTPPSAERLGDRLQVVLPVLGLGCAVANGTWLEYAARFGLLEGAVHGTKALTDGTQLGTRPDGGGKGFPSGHTAAATFGASALVHTCLRRHPVAAGAAVISAAFTGASRIEAQRHDIWQVLAGWLLGWAVERGFRSQAAGLLRRRSRRLKARRP